MKAKAVLLTTLVLTIILFGKWAATAMLLFFIAGVVPGTSFSLSPSVMLVVFVLNILLLSLFFAKDYLFTVRKTYKRPALPSRRYTEL